METTETKKVRQAKSELQQTSVKSDSKLKTKTRSKRSQLVIVNPDTITGELSVSDCLHRLKLIQKTGKPAIAYSQQFQTYVIILPRQLEGATTLGWTICTTSGLQNKTVEELVYANLTSIHHGKGSDFKFEWKHEGAPIMKVDELNILFSLITSIGRNYMLGINNYPDADFKGDLINFTLGYGRVPYITINAHPDCRELLIYFITVFCQILPVPVPHHNVY